MSDTSQMHQQISAALLLKANLSVTDAAGNIIWVNDNFCRLCGYSRTELIGKTHSLLSSGTHTLGFYQTLWKTILGGDNWQGEICNKKKSGHTYWDETTIIPILDGLNQPIQFVALHSDISTRRNLFEQIKKRAQRQGLVALLGRSAVNGHNLQLLLDQAISAVSVSFNMTMGMVLQHTATNKLLLRSACGVRYGEPGITEFEMQANDLVQFVHANDEPVTIDNIATDKRFVSNSFFLQQKTDNGILLTLGDRNSPWGLLAFFSNNKIDTHTDDIFFLLAINSLLTETIFLYDMEAKLANEKELSQKYLDMANVMFIALSEKGEIILANQQANTILGYMPDETIGLNWFDAFVPESTRETLRTQFKTIVTSHATAGNSESHHTSTVITRSGSTRLIKWRNSVVYDNNNNFVFLLAAGEDITDQIKATREKERIQQELQQAKKIEAIGHLAGGISHDFNNILASIIGYTGLAMERQAVQDDKKLLDYLSEVERAGNRAADIIASLANFGKSSKNNLQPTLLPTLLKGTLRMLRSAIPASIIFEQNIDMETPAVLIDAENFNQLMMHLLIHARDQMKQEGTLRIELNSQTIQANVCTSCQQPITGQYAQLMITSSHSFPGADAFKIVFDTTSPQVEASELLQIHRMVHASSGHIIIQPTESGNTRICLLFPIANANESMSSTTRPGNKSGARIMIVDDENSVAGYLSELLEQCQYIPTVFTDPTDALKNFMATPDHYDLILTDQTMPLLTGLNLSKSMLTIRPDLPIILMTGYSDVVDANIAEQNNIRAFLKKPLETHVILECIYRLLSETK